VARKETSMFLRLFLAFTVIPVIELYLILQVGHAIGVLPTVLAILTAALLGAALARQQGLKALSGVRTTLMSGRMPTDALIDALLIFAAGILLVAPGFLTDFLALFMLLPLTRKPIRELIKRRLARGLKRGKVKIFSLNGRLGRW